MNKKRGAHRGGPSTQPRAGPAKVLSPVPSTSLSESCKEQEQLWV